MLYLVFYKRDEKYVRSLPLEASSIPPPGPFPTFSSLVPSFLRRRTLSSASTASSNSSFDPRSVLLPGQVRQSSIILSPEYRLSLGLFGITLLHFVLSILTTAILLLTLPGMPKDGSPPVGRGEKEHPSEAALRVWATTLGIMSVVLALVQYAPQILLTFRRKLVGSLSIPMMCLQVRARSSPSFSVRIFGAGRGS